MVRAKQWKVKDNRVNEEKSKEQAEKQIVVKVRKKGWVSKGEKIIYTVFSIGLMVACLYIVSFASKTDQLNRELLSLEQTVHDQKIENEALYFEASELSSPERIIKIARENGLKIQDAKVKKAITVNE